MYIDTIRTSTLALTEDTVIFDDGTEKEVHFMISDHVKVQYLSVPKTSGENIRIFHLASDAVFLGA